MNAVSLFSGCGGMDLAFERAGFESTLQCEIDLDCLSVLARHWPDVRRETDVRSMGVHREDTARAEDRGGPSGNGVRADSERGSLGGSGSDVDVIHFGSPCQDLSMAGRRAGFAGERSGLFTEAVKAIRAFRPALALWENVPGALSSSDGRDFGTALDLLADAGALDIGWRVLDAQFVGGCEVHRDESGIGPVPQSRRRVFVVADFRARRAGQILFEPNVRGRYPAAGGEAAEGVAPTLTGGARGGSNHGKRSGGERYVIPVGLGGKSDIGYAVRASPSASGDKGDGGMNTNVVVVPVQTVDFLGSKDQGGSAIRPAGAPSFTVDASAPHGVAIAQPLNGHHSRYDADTARNYVVARTVSAKFAKGSGGPASDETANLFVVRKFTPRECERLQGLPDDWTRYRADGTELSDSARYRMIGNSVAVPVVQWIAGRMREALTHG